MEKTIEIIFTDNVKLYRDFVIAELKPFNIKCIGEAANGKELLDLLPYKKPDVVLLDLEMPVMDGNDAFKHIMSSFPDTKVIMISRHCEELLIEDYIKRGAKGYIPKDEIGIKVLATGIRKVAEGEIFIKHLSSEYQNSYSFTGKERKILPMILQGFTNEEIAKFTEVSIRTIERQRQTLCSKMGDSANSIYEYGFSKGLQYLEKIEK